jgi:hypothetical protein
VYGNSILILRLFGLNLLCQNTRLCGLDIGAVLLGIAALDAAQNLTAPTPGYRETLSPQSGQCTVVAQLADHDGPHPLALD